MLCDGATPYSVVSCLPATEVGGESSSAVSRLPAAEEGTRKGKGKGKDNVDPDDKIIGVTRPFDDMKCPNCDGCGNAVSYKLQQFTDEKLEDRDGGFEIWHRLYHCAECMSKAWDCSVGEAQARIVTEKPSTKSRATRAQKFKEADTRMAAEFKMLDTKAKRRNVTVAAMCELIEDLFVFIDAKRRVLRARDGLLNEHTALIDQIAACSNFKELTLLKEKVLALEAELDDKERQLAFRAKGEEMQSRFCNAADYDDSWSVSYYPDGSIKSAIRSWWLCLSGGEDWPCCTVVLAKIWCRSTRLKHGSQGRNGNAHAANAKYKPKFGMLVQMHIRGVLTGCWQRRLENTRTSSTCGSRRRTHMCKRLKSCTISAKTFTQSPATSFAKQQFRKS